ncbi:hypothetical protein Gotur_025594, partial [Gossypium turneri]
MKKETISMDAKLMFLWMTWIFLLHNRNQISSTSFHDAATLLAENIRTVGVEISWSTASEVLIQQKSEMTIQERALTLYPTLCEVEGLTEDERYLALSKIPDHLTQMLIFFSLPHSVR